MKGSSELDELDELTRTGERLLRVRDYAGAAAAFERAADGSEVPADELCAKLARALAESGRTAEACEWALRTVDGGFGFTAWSTAAKTIRRCGIGTVPRIRRSLRIGVVSTWTTDAFVPLLQLAAARLGIAAEVYEASFDQYFNETLEPGSALYRSQPEALILCPDRRSLAVPALSEEPEAVIGAAVERWSGVWSAVRSVTPAVIVQHLFAAGIGDAFGHFASGFRSSNRSVTAEINRRLAECAGRETVGIVDVDALASRFGKERWFEERNWHMAKIAVAPAALPVLAYHTAIVLAAHLGLSRRCLVVDLDNTLWGGVIGDDGVGGLTLGDGPAGEAYVEFQQAIKDLGSRGIVLGACSKNDIEIAKEPFREHPEMVLRLDDFGAFVANWRPKSENLLAIARELNLGLDAITFVDDNPYERAEVRRALPEVDVIALPADPTGFRRAIESYACFEPVSFTAEDRERTGQYRARASAEELRHRSPSLDEYQASLEMVATIGAIDPMNMARVVQLINKTNQFNLTTRRRNRAELEELLDQPGVAGFWVRLRDKFADHGLIAVAIGRGSGAVAGTGTGTRTGTGTGTGTVAGAAFEVDTLLMSCRVIGRGVEQVIRDELIERARELGCREVAGFYVRSARNQSVADLWPRLGFRQRSDDGQASWVYDVGDPVASNAFIRVEKHGPSA